MGALLIGGLDDRHFFGDYHGGVLGADFHAVEMRENIMSLVLEGRRFLGLGKNFILENGENWAQVGKVDCGHKCDRKQRLALLLSF